MYFISMAVICLATKYQGIAIQINYVQFTGADLNNGKIE